MSLRSPVGAFAPLAMLKDDYAWTAIDTATGRTGTMTARMRPAISGLHE